MDAIIGTMVIEAVADAHAKWTVPDNLRQNFNEARRLFKEADVVGSDVSLKWTAPDEAGLIQYLCVEKGFSEDRVRSGPAQQPRTAAMWCRGGHVARTCASTHNRNPGDAIDDVRCLSYSQSNVGQRPYRD